MPEELPNQEAAQTNSGPTLNLSDLQNLLLVVDYAITKRAFGEGGAAELKSVLDVRTKLVDFIQAIAPPESNPVSTAPKPTTLDDVVQKLESLSKTVDAMQKPAQVAEGRGSKVEYSPLSAVDDYFFPTASKKTKKPVKKTNKKRGK